MLCTAADITVLACLWCYPQVRRSVTLRLEKPGKAVSVLQHVLRHVVVGNLCAAGAGLLFCHSLYVKL
jgi:hypothetical protein